MVESNSLHLVRAVVERTGEVEGVLGNVSYLWVEHIGLNLAYSSGPSLERKNIENALPISIYKRVPLPKGILFGKGMSGEEKDALVFFWN